ncbi:tRNA pseudouridine(55) synthase TruB [Quisquiliibacterium transsilvanicum]|uniref:tRNA pseudouridine synthase B n=1 Tax=Quisquiliibacterium transsilvanicum TaxID=1549638 RepID=A0A7W8HI08_9BURK|nr:tRNA pseudouridine(55) synthase TruB [Quisquiliibacterium transsilvanicum]MBB5272424.1 tRNA pseudouridine55 synthase [Quisquiliibacterium transsilvanicum]
MNTQRKQRDCIDGLLLLDKPKGMTSNDALLRARRLFNARKAGHGGTLDPMASGLLPIAFGEATKFAGDALGADKAYLAEFTFGITTDTGDAEGAILERRPVDLAQAQVRAAADGFLGEIDQVPPMYSALKRDGRPLYEYARAGITLERAPRRVTIRSIDLIDFGPVAEVAAGEPGSLRAVLRVACSKGTYIRTLAEDIGAVLGCGAHLSALRRERVGALGLAGSVSLDRLEAMTPAERLACLAPVDSLLAALPRVLLDEEHARRFLHGQRLRVPLAEPRQADPRVRVYLRDALLGIATLDGGLLVPQRLVGNAQEPAAADAQ